MTSDGHWVHFRSFGEIWAGSVHYVSDDRNAAASRTCEGQSSASPTSACMNAVRAGQFWVQARVGRTREARCGLVWRRRSLTRYTWLTMENELVCGPYWFWTIYGEPEKWFGVSLGARTLPSLELACTTRSVS